MGKEEMTGDSFQQEIPHLPISVGEIQGKLDFRGNKWQPGLISMGGHRFTVPDLSQWENIRRS